MALKWSDGRRCPTCHRAIPKGEKRCPQHSVDPYWISEATISPPGAPRSKRKVGGKGCVRRSDLDEPKADVEARFDQVGVYREPSKLTTIEYLRQWHQTRKSEVSAGHWKISGYQIEKHLPPSRLGSTRLTDVTRLDVKRFATELEDAGLGRKSRANVVGLVGRAFREAIEDGLYVGANPADGVASAPAHPDREMIAWDADELQAFIAATADHELGTLFRVLASSGMRRSEALALRWTEIDLDAGRLQVIASVADDRGDKRILKAPKTARGRRTIGIDAGTVTALRALRSRQAAAQLAVGASWQDDTGAVFTNEIGQPVKRDRTSRTFNRLIHQIDGLRVCRLHDLRHSAASHLARQGFSLIAVSRIMGHASASFTADQYGHLFTDQIDEAAVAMGVVLDG